MSWSSSSCRTIGCGARSCGPSAVPDRKWPGAWSKTPSPNGRMLRRAWIVTRLRAVYSPHYSFELGPGHPFPMAKYRRVHEALLADGTLAPDRVIAAAPATEEELAAAHSRDYVDRFLQGDLSAQEQRRLGFPGAV